MAATRGKLSLKEAAHRLRMTVSLIQWFTRCPPIPGNPRVLKAGSNMTFAEAELTLLRYRSLARGCVMA
jgi:hypothetical protein